MRSTVEVVETDDVFRSRGGSDQEQETGHNSEREREEQRSRKRELAVNKLQRTSRGGESE